MNNFQRSISMVGMSHFLTQTLPPFMNMNSKLFNLSKWQCHQCTSTLLYSLYKYNGVSSA